MSSNRRRKWNAKPQAWQSVRAWMTADTIALSGAVIAMLAIGIALALDPDSVTWTTYPDLSWPPVNLMAMAGLALLMIPAFFSPPGRTR